MTRLMYSLVLSGALLATGVACGDKSSGDASKDPTPEKAPPTKTVAAASKPTTVANVGKAAPAADDAPASDDTPVPVEADFEAEADSQITKDNYKKELETIETEIKNDAE